MASQSFRMPAGMPDSRPGPTAAAKTSANFTFDRADLRNADALDNGFKGPIGNWYSRAMPKSPRQAEGANTLELPWIEIQIWNIESSTAARPATSSSTYSEAPGQLSSGVSEGAARHA